MLRAEDLTLGYPGRRLVEGLSLECRPGQVWAVLGRNGSGKSTLLRALAGLQAPTSGTVSVDGRPLDAWLRRPLARRLGVLLQEETREFWGSVREYVLLGRYPHAASPFGWLGEDEAVADAEIAAMHLEALAGRAFATLSGGERQRARAAALFAQRTAVHLLDEPLQHLDLAHQALLLERLVREARERSGLVVMVLHDLMPAARYCDHFLLLYGDGRFAVGAGADFLTAARMSELYGTALDAIDVRGERLLLPRRSGADMSHV